MIYMIKYEAAEQIGMLQGYEVKLTQDFLESLETNGLLAIINDEDLKVSPAFLYRYYLRRGFIELFLEEQEEIEP